VRRSDAEEGRDGGVGVRGIPVIQQNVFSLIHAHAAFAGRLGRFDLEGAGRLARPALDGGGFLHASQQIVEAGLFHGSLQRVEDSQSGDAAEVIVKSQDGDPGLNRMCRNQGILRWDGGAFAVEGDG